MAASRTALRSTSCASISKFERIPKRWPCWRSMAAPNSPYVVTLILPDTSLCPCTRPVDMSTRLRIRPADMLARVRRSMLKLFSADSRIIRSMCRARTTLLPDLGPPRTRSGSASQSTARTWFALSGISKPAMRLQGGFGRYILELPYTLHLADGGGRADSCRTPRLRPDCPRRDM